MILARTCTTHGRVVYNRKKHVINGYDILRQIKGLGGWTKGKFGVAAVLGSLGGRYGKDDAYEDPDRPKAGIGYIFDGEEWQRFIIRLLRNMLWVNNDEFTMWILDQAIKGPDPWWALF